MVDQALSVEAPVPTDYTKMLEDVLAREKVIKTEWLDKTKDIYAIYEGSKADSTPFNILYSNTEILVPNIFSSAPKPIVRKRFGEMRADMASQAAERMAEYCMDTNLSGYPEFVDVIEATVLDAALPGQGQTRIRVVEGSAIVDYVQHDEFIWGYAKRWEDVPWVAYRSNKTIADIKRELDIDPEIAAQLKEPEASASSTKDEKLKTTPVYEVWNKLTRKVYFLSECLETRLLKELDDPLQMSGFFPSGKPLRLLETPRGTMPKATYNLYRKQAEELNAITLRIKRVIQAIKVRGLYDGSLAELGSLLNSEDQENNLVAASNPGGMARDGGLEKHVFFLPIDKFIIVLQQLFVAREQVKSTIYEILGIGDILRGVTQASETASAQQIKDKWGSLRIKKSRERVSSFVRWNIRALIEVSAKHVPEENWAKVTGLELMPTMQAQLLAQQPQAPGQPRPQPSWGETLQLLKDDLTRSYVIDIETNSTVDSAATEDKEEVTDFMNALGQSMPAIQGLASQGPEGHEAAKTLLVGICRRFRMGAELESVLHKIPPMPQGQTPEQLKAQQEMQKKEQELAQQEDQVKQAGEGLKAQFEQQKQQIDQAGEQLKAQQAALDKSAQDLQEAAAKLDADKAALDLERREIELLAREKVLDVKAVAQEVAKTVSKAEVDHEAREVEFAGKQATEVKAEGDTKLEAVTETLKLMQEQGAALTKLLEMLAKPVKIVQTGPKSFERHIG